MGDDYTIGIGTVGWGAWFSYDRGGSWRQIHKRLDPEGTVRAIEVSPHDPHHVLATVDHSGVFHSRDGGYMWAELTPPVTDRAIWSLAVDPIDPDQLYVGTRPGAFRSSDGGQSWSEMDVGISDQCPIGVPRTTNVVVDHRDRDTLWVGVEVDGIYRSRDRGDTWAHLGDIGDTPFHNDIHGLAQRGDELLVGTPFGLATSTDDGDSFSWQGFDGFGLDTMLPGSYCRGVFVKTDDPDTILVGTGDYIPGQVGAIEISRDGGQNWDRADLPVEPNSTVYWMALHPDLPDVIVATSILGYVYVSEDGGRRWTKLDREFGHLRSVSLAPT